MIDTIIKGAGNSRSIRSVPNLRTLAPTYDKLLEMLTGEGLPIDLGFLNPAGCEQIGTNLDKGTLLSDGTETTIWGDTENRTVDEALAQISRVANSAQITANSAQANANSRAKIASGSYIGNGSASGAVSKTLYFPFNWYLFFLVFPEPQSKGWDDIAIAARGQANNFAFSLRSGVAFTIFEQSNTSLTMGGTGYYNITGVSHKYFVIGA